MTRPRSSSAPARLGRPAPPPALPPPAPAAPAVAPVAGPPGPNYEARARWQRAVNMVLNLKQFGDVKPGRGILGMAGTTGGEVNVLSDFLRLRDQHGGEFPWRWSVRGNDYNDLIALRPVTARAIAADVGDHRPLGPVPFVVVRPGEVFIGPSLRVAPGIRQVNHLHVADLTRRVTFAGVMVFGAFGANKSVLQSWSSDSGGYLNGDDQAANTGLPIDLYVPRG